LGLYSPCKSGLLLPEKIIFLAVYVV